jgi:L-lactate dehydrogenase complex protein LldF
LRRALLAASGALLRRPAAFASAGWLARRLGAALPPRWRAQLGGPWTRNRELPDLPPESFRRWYARRERARRRQRDDGHVR